MFIAELFCDYRVAYHLVYEKYKKIAYHFLIASAILLIIIGLETLTPYFLGQTANQLSEKNNPTVTSIFFAIAYGICWTVTQVGQWAKTAISSLVLTRCSAVFQEVFYLHLIRLDFAHLLGMDAGKTATIIARSRSAFGAISFSLFWGIIPTLVQFVLSSIILLEVTGAYFAISFMMSMIFLFFMTWRLASKSKSAHQNISSAINSLASHLAEKLTFILDIKINHAYSREEKALKDILSKYILDVSSADIKLAHIFAIQSLCAGILLICFTVFAVLEVSREALKVGDFIMIVGYIVQLTVPFTRISSSLSDLRRYHLALREGLDILAIPTEFNKSPVNFDTSTSPLYCIENACLVLNGKTILKDVNFVAQKNQLSVLLGPSGGGKSCLLKMLCGLLHPIEGVVRLYGIDLSQTTSEMVAREVAVVPQHSMILSGSVRENLVFGCETTPSDHFLLEILEELGLTELRGAGLTKILDQPLGMYGCTLSGGERQRIALARALARRPAVLILDEPTASLDTACESRIIACLKKRVPSIIVATHHAAFVEFADCVYQIHPPYLVATVEGSQSVCS